MQKALIVAESFYSSQGEGQTMGVPSVFLRLAGCNLLCHGAGWRCDTIEVWQKGRSVPFEEVLSPAFISKLTNQRAHLVITGGEPLLHQHKIMSYLNWLSDKYKFNPIVEIETNGTLVPDSNFFAYVTYWNCSPKLSTTGEPYSRRVNEVALRKISTCSGRGKAIFKFVISCEADVQEVFTDFDIPHDMIMFMPAGASRDELDAIRPMVVEQSLLHGVRYCDRLHIVVWNQKTGV